MALMEIGDFERAKDKFFEMEDRIYSVFFKTPFKVKDSKEKEVNESRIEIKNTYIRNCSDKAISELKKHIK